MLTILLTIVYVAVCVFLILVVLLQTGKRADLAGAFGGGGSQTAFGARGAATALSKATTFSAAGFMVLALALAILSSRHANVEGSVLDQIDTAPLTQPQPERPGLGDDAGLPPAEPPPPAEQGATPPPAGGEEPVPVPPPQQP